MGIWKLLGSFADDCVFCGSDGRVAPRSGLASKNFIDTGAGVIDADYRGEVKVLLFNFSDVDFEGMYKPFASLLVGKGLVLICLR